MPTPSTPASRPCTSVGPPEPPAPRFQRYLPDGREYYFWIDRSLPDIERRGGHCHIHRQTITVRVQWRRNTENDDLPRVLPAPGPTEPRPDDLLTPDFERTGQPGWADERTYPADDGKDDRETA
ncbi:MULTISPECIES: hypothetical protein [unclassified Thioalkalivibrio]|uniref:hypothetical protein n=1 Tax=unclassified Thioalkalivibrio TaxID=2621013 RepID=UPI001E422AFF|nr:MULTISPECIES: hypothetical protein [unclassified Thioalkalivibrio]